MFSYFFVASFVLSVQRTKEIGYIFNLYLYDFIFSLKKKK